MRRLSFIIGLLGLHFLLTAQSPHGEGFTMDCAVCHSSDSWELARDIYSFDHDATAFPLEGRHDITDCRLCHTNLEFAGTATDCAQCHNDVHNLTTGLDCARCHTPESWVVGDITGLHQQASFPLQGPHVTADCIDCHVSAYHLQFDPIGNECIHCHSDDYLATTLPNHQDAGFSTDCSECHRMNSFIWISSGINHDFFPLTQGHAITNCAECHTSGNYSGTSPDCISCHLQDYSSTKNPNHEISGFPMDCANCHSTNPGWQPASFTDHDALYFPIYSGRHRSEWNTCAECHLSSQNFAVFTCTDCHEHNKPDTDDEHREVNGYSYQSTACYACHPTGDEEGRINHNETNFPLTGAHVTVNCTDCHSAGYQGTSTLCADCHTPDFNQTTNPQHVQTGFSNDCARCHTTNPDWSPADFPDHNEIYPLEGAHASIAGDCAECHQSSNYSDVPNTCYGCHQSDFNQASDPNHQTQGFSHDCTQCHSLNAWQPADFDHNQTGFALTGAHTSVNCAECHTSGYDNTPSDCAECHTADFNSARNPDHRSLNLSTDCARCHTIQPGWSPADFPDHDNFYPLLGAHASIAGDCAECHQSSNYSDVPNTCYGCHQSDFNQASDPNHQTQGFSHDCTECHSQNTWEGAVFDHDNQFFPIYSGKHKEEWNDCSDCHTTSGNYSIFSCIDCHEHNRSETDKDHDEVRDYTYNSIACLECHPTGRD